MSFYGSKVDISGPKNEIFEEKMMFPKSIGNQSGMVPGPSGHQKTLFWMGWRMCCLAAGLEGTIHMTLRADTGSE